MLILTSSSPRRQALIKKMGLDFRCISIQVDENYPEDLSPEKVVKMLSLKKALHGFDVNQEKIHVDDVLIAADTVVSFEGKIFNKPKNFEECFHMLKTLQGKTHEVFTGFTLKTFDRTLTDSERTRVCFSSMTDQDIERYIQKVSPFDKAGGYGIQDELLSCFVSSIHGCYYNVVGFPIAKIYKSLKNFYETLPY